MSRISRHIGSVVLSVGLLVGMVVGVAQADSPLEGTIWDVNHCITEQQVGSDYHANGQPLTLGWGGNTLANVYASGDTCDGDNGWYGKVDDIRTDGSCVETWIRDGSSWVDNYSCGSPKSVIHVDNGVSRMRTCLPALGICNPYILNINY